MASVGPGMDCSIGPPLSAVYMISVVLSMPFAASASVTFLISSSLHFEHNSTLSHATEAEKRPQALSLTHSTESLAASCRRTGSLIVSTYGAR